MITLIKKIADIDAEILLAAETIIPDLRERVRLSIEAYESAENEEAEAKALGEMETLSDRVGKETKAMVRLKQRQRKLKLYLSPRERKRRPCGRC